MPTDPAGVHVCDGRCNIFCDKSIPRPSAPSARGAQVPADAIEAVAMELARTAWDNASTQMDRMAWYRGRARAVLAAAVPVLLSEQQRRIEAARCEAWEEMRPDFQLCGCMVGLKLRRERWFETSWQGFAMSPPHHHRGPVVSVVGHGTPSWVREQLGFNPTIADYREAMGIDWMNRNELSQAIPPAYCELIGAHLMAALSGRVSA